MKNLFTFVQVVATVLSIILVTMAAIYILGVLCCKFNFADALVVFNPFVVVLVSFLSIMAYAAIRAEKV